MRAVTNEHVVNIKHSASFFEAYAFIKCAPESKLTRTQSLGLLTLPSLHCNSKLTNRPHYVNVWFGRTFQLHR